MASRAAKVDQSAFGQKNDVTPILHEVAVDLRLNVLNALGVRLQPCHVNFDVKMSDIWRGVVSEQLLP